MKKCRYCNNLFDMPDKIFANHVRWCEKNPNRNSWNKTSLKRDTNAIKYGNKISEKRICPRCGEVFTLTYREFGNSFKKKYCSRKCANVRLHTEDTKNKISKSNSYERVSRKCKHCNNEFIVLPNSKKQFCSYKCIAKYRVRNINTESLSYYRNLCAFSFSLKDFPDEFDFSLIDEFGWYAAKNRGNNLNGVSRDHIVSIKYGYEHHIDPNIISHPANCQLMLQNNNASKGISSNITIEDLYKKIEQWNLKYGV